MSFNKLYAKYLKRAFDIVAAAIGCVFFIPFYAFIKCIHVIQNDQAPVIFKQNRVGLNGKEFVMYKFRTMVPNAEEQLSELLRDPSYRMEWNANHKLTHDPRITETGLFLRRTSLDELPQFINILLGDMSLVGPRPLLPGELEQNGGLLLYNSIRPGLTGWWACNGRSAVRYDERLKMEYYYINNVSLKLDLICLFKTLIVVFTERGAE